MTFFSYLVIVFFGLPFYISKVPSNLDPSLWKSSLTPFLFCLGIVSVFLIWFFFQVQLWSTVQNATFHDWSTFPFTNKPIENWNVSLSKTISYLVPFFLAFLIMIFGMIYYRSKTLSEKWNSVVLFTVCTVVFILIGWIIVKTVGKRPENWDLYYREDQHWSLIYYFPIMVLVLSTLFTSFPKVRWVVHIISFLLIMVAFVAFVFCYLFVSVYLKKSMGEFMQFKKTSEWEIQ